MQQFMFTTLLKGAQFPPDLPIRPKRMPTDVHTGKHIPAYTHSGIHTCQLARMPAQGTADACPYKENALPPHN